MSLNNRRRLFAISGLVLLGGSSSFPFIANTNLLSSSSHLGGAVNLKPYLNIVSNNKKDLQLSSSSVRPSQALEETKHLETNNLELNIEKPNLKVNELIRSSDEKENVTTIFKEIKKETQVLEIQKEKDDKYSEFESKLKDHKTNYFDFKRGIQKRIKRVEKKEKRRSRRDIAEVRNKRYSLDTSSEESFNILKEIGEIKEEDKKAVIEFYKSYVDAADTQKELFEKLKKIDGVDLPNIKTINTKDFKENVDYLKEIDLNDPNVVIIDLSGKKHKNPPKNLLSINSQNLMGNKYKEFDREINRMKNGTELNFCQFNLAIVWTLFSGGQDPCYEEIIWMKENQKTLNQAAEFQILLKLLKDMKQSQTRFEITYEETDKYNWLYWKKWKEKRFYFLY